ncbi:MAG: magnetochrome domain-containing protein [Rhodospirillaceae bacterium]
MIKWVNQLIDRALALVPGRFWVLWETGNHYWARAVWPLLGIGAILTAGLFFLTFGRAVLDASSEVPVRVVDGDYLGTLPRPIGPSLIDPIANLFRKQPDFKLMAIRRIPPIAPGSGMPHPYVGLCTNCHLYVNGPPPGSQFKTPVGAMLEQLSRLHKLGPPIRPNAEIPHPPAGRCIKCHDIVVKIPIEPVPGGFIWKL